MTITPRSLGRSILITTLLLIVGCSTANLIKDEAVTLVQRSGIQTQVRVERRSQFTLPRASSFYLARNPAIDELTLSYGFAVTEVLETEAARYFGIVQTGMMPENLAMAMRSAARSGLDFIVFPRLLAWDDDIGNWVELGQSLVNESSRQTRERLGLDEVELQLMMIHAATGRVVDVANVAANSGMLSFYGDKPDTLLQRALRDYFSALIS